MTLRTNPPGMLYTLHRTDPGGKWSPQYYIAQQRQHLLDALCDERCQGMPSGTSVCVETWCSFHN